MRTTIDLPDPLFRDLKMLAVRRGVTLKALIQESVEKELKGNVASGYRVKHPLIPRKGRHTINLTNVEIEEIFANEDAKKVLA